MSAFSCGAMQEPTCKLTFGHGFETRTPCICWCFVQLRRRLSRFSCWRARRPRPKRKRSSTGATRSSTVFVSRDETGRTRTKIIVQKRSYLDGGTEVLPGQRHFLDYAIPPYYSPLETALGPGKNFDRMPLNPQWENGWPRMWFP